LGLIVWRQLFGDLNGAFKRGFKMGIFEWGFSNGIFKLGLKG